MMEWFDLLWNHDISCWTYYIFPEGKCTRTKRCKNDTPSKFTKSMRKRYPPTPNKKNDSPTMRSNTLLLNIVHSSYAFHNSQVGPGCDLYLSYNLPRCTLARWNTSGTFQRSLGPFPGDLRKVPEEFYLRHIPFPANGISENCVSSHESQFETGCDLYFSI